MFKHRALLLAILVALSTLMTLAAAVSGWVQVRKAQEVQLNKLEWKDSIGHNAVGFERQFLQFRGRLAAVLMKSDAASVDDLALRWEVFVSRVRLLSSTQGMEQLYKSAAFQTLLPKLDALVVQGDALFATQPLPAAQGAAMLMALDAIADDVQMTTLAAASVTSDLVEQQFSTLQQQAVLIGSLAALQLLVLVVVGFALRAWQKQQLEARLRLEQLAGELSEAKFAAETAALTKSQFLANMSHELRTPFQGVLGMLQLLQKTSLSRSQQELVQTAHGSANHLLCILNEILDLSVIESGKAIFHCAPLDLHRLCAEVEAPMRVQAEERGLTLVVQVEASTPAWVEGDATRIKQILFNLVGNAIKFTPKGEVRLDVHGIPLPEGGCRLSFVVTDTGLGMDAQTRSRLFQRFAPGDASLTRRFGGAGLGLEISRNLARLMGGDLEVSSELGKGSSFAFTLQLKEAEPQSEVVQHAPAAHVQRAFRVLVVDDHPINRRYMGLVLESLQHRATFCTNGREALQQVQAGEHDVILMDIHMPVMDGLEATRAIRALGGRFASIPILALTADVLSGSRERALEAGCTGFLTKPVQIEGLTAALGLFDGAPAAPDGAQALSARFEEMAARLPAAKLRELLEMFFVDESGALAALRDALQSADAALVLAAAHKCKGSASLLGLQGVADAAKDAEDWARSEDPRDHPGAIVAAFDAALVVSREALDRRLEMAE